MAFWGTCARVHFSIEETICKAVGTCDSPIQRTPSELPCPGEGFHGGETEPLTGVKLPSHACSWCEGASKHDNNPDVQLIRTKESCLWDVPPGARKGIGSQKNILKWRS